MALKNCEIEFKYLATNVKVSEFKDFCEKRDPKKFVIISGFDHFYSKAEDSSSFYRHRVNTNENQLTFKRKTTNENNFIREEHNIDLPLNVSEEKIKSLCAVNGYKYNTSIFKNCFIYNYDYYTLVYYICYDLELNELSRFIEIEMREDHDWSSEQEAFNSMAILEKTCSVLGISSKLRLNKSLYEMFRKELK